MPTDTLSPKLQQLLEQNNKVARAVAAQLNATKSRKLPGTYNVVPRAPNPAESWMTVRYDDADGHQHFVNISSYEHDMSTLVVMVTRTRSWNKRTTDHRPATDGTLDAAALKSIHGQVSRARAKYLSCKAANEAWRAAQASAGVR